METSLKLTLVTIAVLLGVAVLAGCTKVEPLNPARDQGSVDHPVTCMTLAECEEHDNREVSVVGVYTTYEMDIGKGYRCEGFIQIVLLGGGGPLLGHFWDAESKRDPWEISKYEGRRVVVVGRYCIETPPNPDDPPHASRLSIPCILDIRSIDPAEDEGTELKPEDWGEDESLDPVDLPRL